MKNCFVLLFVFCSGSNLFAQCWRDTVCCEQPPVVWQRAYFQSCDICQSCNVSQQSCNSCQTQNQVKDTPNIQPSLPKEPTPDFNLSPKSQPQPQGEVVPKFDLSYQSVLIRTWTDDSGYYQVKGKLSNIYTYNGATYIKIVKESGITTTVNLRRLSQRDLQYIQSNQQYFVSK